MGFNKLLKARRDLQSKDGGQMPRMGAFAKIGDEGYKLKFVPTFGAWVFDFQAAMSEAGGLACDYYAECRTKLPPVSGWQGSSVGRKQSGGSCRFGRDPAKDEAPTMIRL